MLDNVPLNMLTSKIWCSVLRLIEAWLLYLWWLLALSASLESAEKEEVAAQHGEEIIINNECQEW